MQDIAQSAAPSTTHLVATGETLYSIAFKYGLNYQKIAEWNNISSPYVIYPGQRLALRPSSRASVRSSATTAAVPSSTQEDEQSVAKQETNASPSASGNVDVAPAGGVVSWVWPVKGRIITSYQRSGEKGIDISGELGDPIHAAAEGRIVYSGGGLIGYGELIIIKHNKNFLSAYGHNNKLLVKQGDFVKSGQRIATMGRSGTHEVKLHFEIRRDGKPVDPIRYLPK